MPDKASLDSAFPTVPQEMRWRHRFSITAVVTAVLLVAMGGFVTSINAGLAVPDWPTSFGSADPFRPLPDWWKITPILAEHGHRLMGALVGLLTTILAVWTWKKDPRGWMRKLGFFALLLVIFQGILGGLRVVWISLDLAVVHACMAQLFFATLLSMTIFTSKAWLQRKSMHASIDIRQSLLPKLAGVTAAVLYLQIILGALLRHPGEGIDTALAYAHIAGATAALGLILATGTSIRRHFADHRLFQRHRYLLYGLTALQVCLGLMAYVVLLDETGRLVEPSTLQVVVNTSHLVIGSLLFGTSFSLVLWGNQQPLLKRLPIGSGSTSSASSISKSTQLA